MPDIDILRSDFEGIRDERRTAANTANRIGNALLALLNLLGDLDFDEKYLSKVHDDTAAGEITFLKGLKSMMLAKFGNYLRNGASKSGAAITPDGLGDFLNIVFSEVLKGYGARSGFTDGKGIYMDARQGLIETDGLEVRGFMRIMELVINRLQLMESDYSFTEGGEIEHVDYTNDGRLLLRMHKRHDNDYTPFYQGDILYAKVNDLLPRNATVPDGHTVTKNGSYYTVWMVVDEVDFSENTLTVSLYQARENGGDPIVPGGMNFTPYGTPIMGTDHPSVAITTEKAIVVDGQTLGETGYDCSITVTRHGNAANSADTAIRERQMERQQSWVLSTTDKRLSFFWRVDQPIIRDDNFALCLGILPNLANLPVTRDPQMPSLYINTIFYENIHHIYYPSRIVKEDRGEWTQNPQVEYTGPSGTYTPDGTLSASEQQRLGAGGTFTQGQMISEPYHYQEVTRNTWLTCRLSPAWTRLSDSDLLGKIKVEWHLDLETSRVWLFGALWECREEGTAEEPGLTSTKWTPVTTPAISLGFFSTDGVPLTNLPIRDGAVINETIVPKLIFGQFDASSAVRRWQWERESAFTQLDAQWGNTVRAKLQTIVLTNEDFPSGWENAPLSFKCTAWFGYDGEESEITNVIQVF